MWLFEHCNVTGNALILGLKLETDNELFEAIVEAGPEAAELDDDSEDVEHWLLADGVYVGQSTLGQWCDMVFVFTVDEAVNVVLIETLDGAGVSTGLVQHSVRTASDHKSSLSQPEISLLLITASAEGLVVVVLVPHLDFPGFESRE